MKKLSNVIEETEKDIHQSRIDAIKEDFKNLQEKPLSEIEMKYLDNINQQITDLMKQKSNAIVKAREKLKKCRSLQDFDITRRERDKTVTQCDSEIANLNSQRRFMADIYRKFETEESRLSSEIASLENEIALQESRAKDASSYDDQQDAQRILFELRKQLSGRTKELETLVSKKATTEDPRVAKTNMLKKEYLQACKQEMDSKLDEMEVMLNDHVKTLQEMDHYSIIYMGSMLSGKTPQQINASIQLVDIYTEKRKFQIMAEKLEQMRKELKSL